MKKYISIILIFVIALTIFAGCNQNFAEQDENQEIYRAKEYAQNQFEENMPDEYMLDHITSSVGDDPDDHIYLILMRYKISGKTGYHYYSYKILVDGDKVSVAEEGSELKESQGDNTWYVNQEDGNMYYFQTEDIGWRLAVVDAATGSRFYTLEKTEHGDKHPGNWRKVNENPFDGKWGVAQGLKFFDQDFGFASISSADETNSSVFVTRNGGITFEKITLPMDTVTELPIEAEDLEYTIKDYDYLNMPEEKEGKLYILVTTARMYKDGITFCSEDDGVTWQVVE